MAPPPEPRRPYKRPAISDQQRRRELALQAQSARRADAQARARALASSLLTTPTPPTDTRLHEEEDEHEEEHEHTVADVAAASKLRGSDARRWFARQIMLPEWMVDAPPQLASDWHVFARPSGKRCLVVSSNGMTISRVRKGSILHRFPSALPNGSKKDISGPVISYSILDCIFQPDQTYYIIDTNFWRGYSLYNCTAEFRFSG